MRLLTRLLFSLRITAARTARPRGSGAGYRGPASDRAGGWGGAPREHAEVAVAGSGAGWLFETEEAHHPADDTWLIRRPIELAEDIQTLIHGRDDPDAE